MKRYKIEYPSIDDINFMNSVASELFDPEDETMVEPNLENSLRLIDLDKNTFICFKDNGIPIAWSLVLPVSKKMKEDFVSGNINERELYSEAISEKSFEALYLFVVVVMPDFRKKGLGSSLFNIQIKYFKETYNIKDYFAWTITREGAALIEKIKRENNLDVTTITRI